MSTERSYRTLFISDVHLGTRTSQAEMLLDFLKYNDADTIYLVGDIIDFWRIKRGAVWPQTHNDVLQKLLRKVRKGTRVIFIPGNHDEGIRDYAGMHFGGIEIERLALNHNMLIALWRVTEDGHIVVIDRAYGEHVVRVDMRVGSRLPFLIGAVGRCVAAHLALPPAELRRRFTTLRWQNPPSYEQYEAEVAEAGRRGWTKDVGYLYRGITTVASAVVDQAGTPRFGISGIAIQGQQTPEQIDRLGEELRDVARYLSRALFPQRQPALAAIAS